VSEGSFAAGLVGIVLDGRYRLDALLGEGGMGAVYRAHHLAMDRRVAVKLLKPHLTTDAAAVQRFAREARSTMRVDSEHAVQVLDFGVTPHGDYYMVLEYLDGRTVQRELDVDGPFEPARVVHIAKQALHALGAAHKSGLVHRDIKPDNILLMRVGADADYVKMLDFGVAKLMEGAARSDRSAMAITQAGMVFGTPEFMSPEQACGQQLDGRSDLYSLATTMFAMLTGCGLFRAKSAIEWLTNHARTPPPHLADGSPALAPYKELDAVLQSCLAKHREDRPQTAEEMIGMLNAIEGTLRQGGRAGLPAMRGPTFSPSAYIAAIDPNATLPPQAIATLVPSRGLGPQTSDLGPATTAIASTAKRGRWIAFGALVVAGMIATTIVLAMRQKSRRSALVAKQTERVAVADATAIDASEIVAEVAVDAAIDASVATDASGPTEARSPKPEARPKAAVDKLIAEAEAAKKSRSLVRWVMKADAALQLDARNVRARFLLAEGLIASGDVDRGCKYLRELRRNPTAQSLARQAGCAID
jgi:tRNA A-37 threonylcarbamoyl transferase component Bud32